jgi:flagellar biogenesis protein FliO
MQLYFSASPQQLSAEWRQMGDRLSLFAILLIALLLAWLGGRFAH